ncbi:HetP family heterocyst commitment protein [Nostoc sp. MS1]|uniref:HetP family heterocyst commitment protein n=1 Tax=Nostoc sp. MS1 TaxID=2764711 RepID=UPI001CC53764|nr:HetP family heterocyst commitment protein [Nostoc sp. MS1]BCL39394.1 hypothetical protein NSMS1_58410 [Nostoc sp. MS1]
MRYNIYSSQSSFQNTITTEQLNQVIEAITEGRYSWACVLILRSVGYNPLHFIPQRTYSRLLKENKQVPSNPANTAELRIACGQSTSTDIGRNN